MSYLDEAKADFEHSQGDVSSDYNHMLKEYAKIKALIAIAEQLERLNNTLDAITSLRGDAIQTLNLGG